MDDDSFKVELDTKCLFKTSAGHSFIFDRAHFITCTGSLTRLLAVLFALVSFSLLLFAVFIGKV